jgi:phosphatidylethanolamine/phosphatidyl-N-methylethanolamine N-methyltransferase
MATMRDDAVTGKSTGGDSAPAQGRQDRSAWSVFLASWWRAPRAVASIAPSSLQLAMAVAEMVGSPAAGDDRWVVELGGGTGAVTQGLVASRLPLERLLVIERDPDLFRYLRAAVPGPVLAQGDALELTKLLGGYQIGPGDVRAVVCGLPMLGMKNDFVDPIMEQAKAALGKEGVFLQYTYSLFSPIDWKRYAMKPVRTKRVLWNIPPAAVWAYRFD